MMTMDYGGRKAFLFEKGRPRRNDKREKRKKKEFELHPQPFAQFFFLSCFASACLSADALTRGEAHMNRCCCCVIVCVWMIGRCVGMLCVCLYACSMYICMCLHRSDPMAPGRTTFAAGMIAIVMLGSVYTPVNVVG